jgi:mannose-1-phosphate guanylyltransferase
VRPSRPETQYGYIKPGVPVAVSGALHCCRVQRFIEKPSQYTALQYVRSGTRLWNSGMFVWKVSSILEEFKKYMPGLYRAARRCSARVCSRGALAAFYAHAPRTSIDYGIMEHTTRAAVVEGAFAWDDVGSWEAMARLHPSTPRGNVVVGAGIDEGDSVDSIIVNTSGRAVAAWGVDNMVVVAVGDAVMVVPRSKIARMKTYLKNAKAAGKFPRDLF